MAQSNASSAIVPDEIIALHGFGRIDRKESTCSSVDAPCMHIYACCRAGRYPIDPLLQFCCTAHGGCASRRPHAKLASCIDPSRNMHVHDCKSSDVYCCRQRDDQLVWRSVSGL